MENMEIYNKVRITPSDAQKKISGGRLNGMTDISPMWRIRKLTEVFGPCGKGWYPKIVTMNAIPGDKETTVQIVMELYVKFPGEDSFSEPIPGIGGSKLVSSERNGLYTDDEAYKKAYTDALGSCCKNLGFSEDIYSSKYGTKYDPPKQAQPHQYEQNYVCDRCTLPVKSVPGKGGKTLSPAQVVAVGKKRFGGCYCADCQRKLMEAQEQREAGN